MKYSLSLVSGILVLGGNLMGGLFAWSGAFFILVVMVILDWINSEHTRSPDPSEGSVIPETILRLHVILHTLCIATLLVCIHNEALHGWALAGAIVSTGLNAGASGIVSAHELIHRNALGLRRLGIWNLLLVHYTHFYTEHIKSHHKYAGTANDPATARRGESFYAFLLRTVPSQFASAVRIDARGQSFKANFVLQGLLMQLLLDAVIFFTLGWQALAAFVAVSVIAIVLLEYVNYIEHYGLINPEARKFEVNMAWQTDRRTSRFTLLELSRHSDHHLKASKPFYTLESHEESPVIPGGYFGVFYIALVPFLWFRFMDHRLPDFTQKTLNENKHAGI